MSKDGRPSEPGPPIVSKGILLATDESMVRSVWLWNPVAPNRLVAVFLDSVYLEPKVVWHVGVDLLEGDVLTGDMKLEYAGKRAHIHMDGEDAAATLTGDAEPFLDFHLDIQVAKSASAFERELRRLINER
jgi:hypothetical protein